MNNRLILTISLYIILNSFFVMMIAQSTIINEPIEEGVYIGDSKDSSNLIYEGDNILNLDNLGKNSNGTYVLELGYAEIFEGDTLHLSKKAEKLISNIALILEKNDFALKFNIYSKLIEGDSLSRMRSYILGKKFMDSIKLHDNLTLSFHDKNSIKLEIISAQ